MGQLVFLLERQLQHLSPGVPIGLRPAVHLRPTIQIVVRDGEEFGMIAEFGCDRAMEFEAAAILPRVTFQRRTHDDILSDDPILSGPFW